nr:hypothetical protein CFP56_09203 [Quercus suber]
MQWNRRIDAAAQACRIEISSDCAAVAHSKMERSAHAARRSMAASTTAETARKRTRAADDDGEREASPPAKHPRRRAPAATVRIPSSEHDVVPRTPMKKRPGATILFTQPTGSSHWITPTEHADTIAPMRAIPEEVLHPPLQGLLFRVDTIPGHPGKSSPFISVSNQVFRVLRIAALERLKIKADGQRVDPGFVTVIDAAALNRKAVFHAKPMCLAAGLKWRPWAADVLRSSTNSLLDPTDGYCAHVQRCPFQETGRGVSDTERTLSADRNCAGCAEKSPSTSHPGRRQGDRSGHSHLWLADDLANRAPATYGWEFQTSYLSPESWLELADCFAVSLCIIENPTISLIGFGRLVGQGTWYRLRAGFLYGMRGSRGHLEALLASDRGRELAKRARKIGLDDPIAMLQSEADGAMLGVHEHERRQRRLLGEAAESDDDDKRLEADADAEYESDSADSEARAISPCLRACL